MKGHTNKCCGNTQKLPDTPTTKRPLSPPPPPHQKISGHTTATTANNNKYNAKKEQQHVERKQRQEQHMQRQHPPQEATWTTTRRTASTTSTYVLALQYRHVGYRLAAGYINWNTQHDGDNGNHANHKAPTTARTANAIAHTSAQDQLTVNVVRKETKQITK